MLRLLWLICLSAILSTAAHAQLYWSAVHTVTGTTSTAVSWVQKTTGYGAVYTTRPTSLIACSSGAATFTLERGGSAPTGTLSTSYPTYTKTLTSGIFPTYDLWPFSFYTASDSTGGVVISKIVQTGASCVPFSGFSIDKKGFGLELQRSSAQLYTLRVVPTASSDVTFSSNGELYK